MAVNVRVRIKVAGEKSVKDWIRMIS
jgi:hypothetical protein